MYANSRDSSRGHESQNSVTGTRLKRALRNIILGVFGKDEYLWFSFMELKSSASECLHFHGNVVTSANRFSMI